MIDDLQNQLFEQISELRGIVVSGQKDVSERLARLETSLIPVEGQPSVLQQHDERIRDLEGYKWKSLGALGILAIFWEWFQHRILQ